MTRQLHRVYFKGQGAVQHRVVHGGMRGGTPDKDVCERKGGAKSCNCPRVESHISVMWTPATSEEEAINIAALRHPGAVVSTVLVGMPRQVGPMPLGGRAYYG